MEYETVLHVQAHLMTKTVGFRKENCNVQRRRVVPPELKFILIHFTEKNDIFVYCDWVDNRWQ